MEWKECEPIIHDHNYDLPVTMVGWVDVRDSDRGDFRCLRVVGTSLASCADGSVQDCGISIANTLEIP